MFKQKHQLILNISTVNIKIISKISTECIKMSLGTLHNHRQKYDKCSKHKGNYFI